MTDRECLEQIIRNLGLIEISRDTSQQITKSNSYYTFENSICIGHGKGEYGCDVYFRFDENGTIIKYGVRP